MGETIATESFHRIEKGGRKVECIICTVKVVGVLILAIAVFSAIVSWSDIARYLHIRDM